VVLKTLDQRLKKIPYFAGATILGDGEVSLIIDANAFID
jgi:two-component system chemotaxis sensor kinase CheA